MVLAVSGLPFTNEDERRLLEPVVEVLRRVFPTSPDVMKEDLTDPARVPREVVVELDQCFYGYGLVSGYLLKTTLCFASYDYDQLLAALCEITSQ